MDTSINILDIKMYAQLFSNPNIRTSVKKCKEYGKNHNLVHMLEKDILATNIYTLGYKKNSLGNLDYTSHYK